MRSLRRAASNSKRRSSPGKLADKVRCLAFLVALVTACTEAERIPVSVETFSLPRPLVDQLPLSVAVLYNPGFKVYQTTINQKTQIYELSLGPASVALFDQVLRSTFENVVTVPARQAPPDGNHSPAIILEPFQKAQVSGRHGPFAGGPTYTVIYGLRFYDLDGQELGRWSVSGRASDLPSAMRNAAAKLLAGLPEQEPVYAALAAGSRIDGTGSPNRDGPAGPALP